MVLRLFALAVAPACFGLAAISRELLPMLFGTGFAPSVPAAVILLVASAVMLSFSISTIYLLSLERTRVVLNFAAIGAVMMIVAGLTIIPLFGPTGAALSRAAIQLFVVSAGAWYAAKYLGAYVPLRGLAIILLAAAIMGLAAYGIADGIGGVAGILAAIASGPLVYGLMLKLLGGLPADDATELMRATALLPSPADRLAPRLIRFISADDSARRSAMPLE